MTKEILVVIPARGGSKGIPRKNLRVLGGKPLIYYSIQNALSIKNYKVDTYVSSDDDEILLMASKFGAKTLLRDNTISEDNTTLDPVIFDAYQRISKLENKKYDLVVTLQATSPLLKSESLEKAIKKMYQNSLDTIISGVYDTHLTWKKEGSEFLPNYAERLNRQYLPEIYKETGGFVITQSGFVNKSSRFGKKVEVYPLSKKEAIDIDDFDDWNLCEYYLNIKVVLFVVTGNPIIGMGHVYNTLSIANEILNHRIIFLVDNTSELAFEKISESNYEVHKQKKTNIIEDIKGFKPDVIINDILDTSAEYILELKKLDCKLINFEDLGEGTKYADVVINAMYPEKKIILNHYYGAKYFILRDEFLYTSEKNNISNKVENVLISFGGVDPNDFTFRVLDIIHNYCSNNDIKITVITGLGYKNSENLKKSFQNAEIKRNINNISDEILNADIVFTSAGRTTFEVAAIGVPAIVLCQNDRETTHFFASQKNGFYNLGLGSSVEDQEIEDAFRDVLDVGLRKQMNKKMLDNKLKKGKARVLKLINDSIQK
ncbi:acylneuraminate cytidylyltransferase [Hyunsoonleella flava]|uniref:Acylneuraminate cytidylyltransferase n=1 Tax=Hyunsoonleella flava TaxID=2527939 RepID=A0A4Q9FBN2_9FLAO|nr:glycosyltransferase [Hyunsoonleella flava]TBN00187.1 acylneuraminate cytidylyltransferase [Hyunsoonleella flava]